MNKFKVRVPKLGAIGFLTQADQHQDYDFETSETLASQLASRGFFDQGSWRWIMPGAIVWIEQW